MVLEVFVNSIEKQIIFVKKRGEKEAFSQYEHRVKCIVV